MKLYTESEKEKIAEIFELNKENENVNIFYMLENLMIIKFLRNKINKIKSISIKKNKHVKAIYNSGLLKCVKFNNKSSKYNLVIICSGYNSSLVRNLFNHKKMATNNRSIEFTLEKKKHEKERSKITKKANLEIFISSILFPIQISMKLLNNVAEAYIEPN